MAYVCCCKASRCCRNWEENWVIHTWLIPQLDGTGPSTIQNRICIIHCDCNMIKLICSVAARIVQIRGPSYHASMRMRKAPQARGAGTVSQLAD